MKIGLYLFSLVAALLLLGFILLVVFQDFARTRNPLVIGICILVDAATFMTLIAYPFIGTPAAAKAVQNLGLTSTFAILFLALLSPSRLEVSPVFKTINSQLTAPAPRTEPQ